MGARRLRFKGRHFCGINSAAHRRYVRISRLSSRKPFRRAAHTSRFLMRSGKFGARNRLALNTCGEEERPDDRETRPPTGFRRPCQDNQTRSLPRGAVAKVDELQINASRPGSGNRATSDPANRTVARRQFLVTRRRIDIAAHFRWARPTHPLQSCSSNQGSSTHR
jgi:hypothetical protein